MTFLYAMSMNGQFTSLTEKFLRVERNKLDPLGSGSFVSIAYYETKDKQIIGLVL